MKEKFRRFSALVANGLGSSWTFLLAIALIVAWALSGPFFDFSTTWQLLVNTGTTIITFLMVFLIQATQNRETKSMQLKLDELLKGVEGSRTSLVGLEDLPDDKLDRLKEELTELSAHTTDEVADGA